MSWKDDVAKYSKKNKQNNAPSKAMKPELAYSQISADKKVKITPYRSSLDTNQTNPLNDAHKYVKDVANTIDTSSILSYEQRQKRIKEINSELSELDRAMSGLKRAALYGNVGTQINQNTARQSKLKEEKKKLERMGDFTDAEKFQWVIDDKKAEIENLRPKIPSKGRMTSSQSELNKERLSALRKAESDFYDLETKMSGYKEIEKLNKLNSYTDKIVGKKDFEQNSKYSPATPKTEAQLKAEGYKKDDNGEWYMTYGMTQRKTYTGEDSDLYIYINDPSKRFALETDQDVSTGINAYKKFGYDTLTDAEKGAFNYLYHQDRKNGTNTAEEYLRTIGPLLEQRAKELEAKRYAEMAKEAPAFMSTVSLGTNFANALMFPAKAAAVATGNYDDMQFLDMYGNRTEAIRGSVSEDMGVFGKLLYNGTMSIGDMGVAMMAGGGSKKLIQAIMSSSAGSSTISNAKENGASDGKALVLGLGSAAIEWATEKYSIEELLKKPEKILGFIATNAVTEGTEEGVSNLSNLALDAIVSNVFGDRNEIEKRIDYLVLHGGKSKEEAMQIAFAEKLQEFGEDVLVGSFTGATMATGRATPYMVKKAVDGIRGMRVETPPKTTKEVPVETSRVVETSQSKKSDTPQPTPENKQVKQARQSRPDAKMPATLRAEMLTRNGESLTVEEAEAASGFGIEGAKALVDFVDKNRGVPFSDFSGQARLAYLAGTSNKMDFKADPGSLQEALFEAGRRDRAMSNVLAEQSKLSYVVYNGKESGMQKENGKVVVPNGMPKIGATVFDYVGQELGLKVQPQERIVVNDKGREANAAITDDGVFKISLNSNLSWAEILGHEPVHRFRQMNTPEYHTFVDFAVQMEEQLERRIANGEGYGMMFEYIRGQYEGAGLQMNAAKNVDEIAARFAQRLFGNERDAMMVIKEMNAHPETRTALQKFMELVQELIWKLQRAWRRLRNQGEYAAARELGMTIKQLEQARKLWAEAYKASANEVEKRSSERESGGAKAEKNTTAVGDVSYSLSSTKRARLEKTILDLSNANIKKIAGEKVIRISTDQYSVNKAIYSKKGRSDREVNARIKSIPEFEDIIRRSVFSHTDTDIIGIDADAKKGVIAMHYFKTSHNGFDIEVLVRDKGKKQFLYEIKFIENKKNSQQSMSNNFDSSAPNGDVENKMNIPQSPESVKSEFSLKDDIELSRGNIRATLSQLDERIRNGEKITLEDAKAASGYGDYGAEVLAGAVNNAEGQTFSQVKGDMHNAYLAGRVNKGMRFETDLQREAYYAGKKDAELGRLIAKKKAGYTTVYGEESGFIPNDASKNVSPKMQKALNLVAKDLGVKVMFADNIFVNKKGDQANAAMGDDGIFRISANSTQPLYELIIHEPFHRMRQLATQEYFDAMNFAVQHAEQLGLRLEQGNGAGTYYEALNNLFTEKGISHDDAKILDELAAQFYQKIVSNDADALRFIQEMNKTEKSRSALQKFMDYVKELIGKLQKAVRKLRNQGEYAAAKQMDMTIKELETARKFYLNAYRATRQRVESRRVEQTWDVMEDANSDENSVAKNPAKEYNGEVSYSLDNYWHTDLTKAQVKTLVKCLQRVGKPTSTMITDTANWFMGRIDGNDVFAIYSTQNAKEPTILYETKTNAKLEKNILMDILEDEENGKSVDEKPSFTERVFKGDWVSDVDSGQNNLGGMGAGTNNQNVGVLSRQPQGNASRAFWNVLENLFKIQESARSNEGVSYSLEREVNENEQGTLESEKITVGMSDDARAELLNKKSVNVVDFDAEKTKTLGNIDFDALQTSFASYARPIIKKIAKEFGILNKTYFNPDIELDFNYSGDSIRESLNKQHAMYGDFIKMLSVFPDVISSAVGIETHKDKYKGTIREDTTLKQMYVLASALRDEKGIIPVKLEVKEFKDKVNKLYLSVVLTKKESRYLSGNLGQNQLNTAPPTSTISIADLVSVVNPSEGDFLKYFPDSMLDSEQIDGKNEAVDKEAKKIKNLTATADHSLKDEVEISPKRTKELLDTIAYLKGQFETTKFAKADPQKLRSMTRKLLKEYSSKLDLSETTTAMEELYRYMANGENGHPAAWDETFRRAKELAARIAESALETDNSNWVIYEDLRNYLRSTTLYIRPDEISDARDFNRRNMGRMRITTTDRTAMGVDEMFQELSEIYPEYFNEDKAGSGSDLLYQMEAVLDSLRPVEFNPFASDMSSAITSIANDMIQNFFEVPQAKPTFADRAEQRVVKARLDGAKKVEAQRESAKRALERAKASKEKALERERKKADARVEKMSETRKAQVLRAKITRVVGNLSRKLVSPTDNQHIPQELQGVVAMLLESINMESNYTYDPETKSYKKNDKGLPTKKTKIFAELKKIYSEMASTLVVDPDFMGDDGLLSEVIAMSDKRIADMTSAELELVWQTVKMVEASIFSSNKIFSAGKFAEVSEVAEMLRKENKGKDAKSEYKYVGGLHKLATLDMLTPETYLHCLGSAGDEIFRMMRNAQDKHISIMKEVADFTRKTLGEVDVKSLEKTIHTVKLGGEDVKMTTAQLMELYVLTKREQALDHIFIGGILPDTIQAKGIEKITKVEPSRGVTIAEIGEALSVLTKKEKAIAEKLQKYMSTTLSGYGNEASMKVYNYEKFLEKNYWPIRTNKQEVHSDVGKDTAVTTVANRGFTRGTKPNANNSVCIGSIFDTFATHSSDMATYAAWLGTSEDVNRIRNFVFWEDQGYDLPKVRTGTIKGVLETVHGKKGSEYLEKLLSDIAIGVKGTDNMNPFDKFIGNYKAASVGANIRVIIQQPTALYRALDLLDGRYLAEGAIHSPLKGWEKAKKYAPIAQWKDWGYFDINTGRQMKDVLFDDASILEKTKQAGMWGASMADSISWGHLWNSVEAEVKSNNKELHVGSAEYYEAVAKRFTEIVDHTQVVDGILQRSQVMRSGDGLVKMASSFMGEPTKQYNMAFSAAYDAKNGAGKARKKALKRLGRTAAALAVSGIMNVCAQSIIDALRDDDKEKEYWEKWLAAFGKNALSLANPLTYVVFVKDVVSLFDGFDVNRMDTEAMQKVVSAVEVFNKTIAGESKYTVAEASAVLVAEIARLFGVPVANLKRDIKSLVMTMASVTDNYLMQYRMEKAMLNVNYSGNTKNYAAILYKAYCNDREAYEIIYDDMIKSGVPAEKIKTQMENQMKKAEGVEETEDLSKRYMSPDDERKYDNSLRKVKTSDAWKSANASQRKEAEAHLYDFLTSSSESMEKTRAEARSAGVDETEYVLWQLAKEVVLGEDDSWNAIKKADAIELIDLGDSELAYFYGTETADKAYSGGVSMENFAKFKADVSGLKGSGKKSKVLAAAERYADNPKEWIFFMGSEYSSYKKRSDYILYFGE